jgi:pimeloyl-ACP methyl ester carboxylesterase
VGPEGLSGGWQAHSFESSALEGNPLGDPATRPLYVWTPQGDGPYPTVYVLQGFTGTAPAWFNVRAWESSFPQVVDELAPGAIVVLVDAFTAIGGSQFLDSTAIGDYHTYLCDEIVPWVEARLPSNGSRAVAGKSSGGFGAMVTAMLRPDLFAGFATHAGDALFEISYRREFVEAARALRDDYDGSFERFLTDFRSRRPLSKKTDHVLINTWAMSAAYSAGELPFDVETAEVKEDVFARWLDWDPVRMAVTRAEALRGMRAIWVDAGRNDEFFLDFGAVAFRRALATAGVPDEVVRFELHEGGHFDTAWRYPLALSYLVERLM